jgi:hypothetical protein
VDYYSCGKAIELFTDIWIKRLKKKPLPTAYCRDLILRIWVAWVFESKSMFKPATAVAIRLSTESLRTLDLPIPAKVSGKLSDKRLMLMTNAGNRTVRLTAIPSD